MLLTVTEMNTPRPIELLAPARDAEVAIEAIKHGADAVYMGASSHGARASAGNTLADIGRVTDYAHRFGARVYVTVNTIIYDSELMQVERLVGDLYRTGVDALIVQDMALLRMDIPPIALHASTQCDIRTPEKARFLQDVGFSQLVLARELSLEETAVIHRATDVPLETFVHGALCVSYSGDCQAGYATMRRSANRGECPQICRHRFDLIDGSGHTIIAGKHLLSMRDLNRSAHLAAMLEAGISSFKIEGRLKDAAYVKNVTGAYRRMLDEIIDSDPQRYVRSSAGVSDLTFTPDLSKSFNRGYTDYFTTSARPAARMAAVDTPKWVGEPVGKVTGGTPQRIEVRLTAELANGDGLGFFDHNREFHGFRVNRVAGNTLYPAQPVSVAAGTTLYRNSDRLRASMLEADTATRLIDVNMTLRATGRGIALDIADTHEHRASAAVDIALQEARTPQEAGRREVLSKTGDTIYRVAGISDTAGNAFIPRSVLASLRRSATEALDRAIAATHRYDYRRKELPDAPLPQGAALSYHDNVSNRMALDFYRSHGAAEVQPAVESSMPETDGMRVMTTRYCLRREYGRCLRTPKGREWPGELYLQSGPMRFRLHFDCAACRMKVLTT